MNIYLHIKMLSTVQDKPPWLGLCSEVETLTISVLVQVMFHLPYAHIFSVLIYQLHYVLTMPLKLKILCWGFWNEEGVLGSTFPLQKCWYKRHASLSHNAAHFLCGAGTTIRGYPYIQALPDRNPWKWSYSVVITYSAKISPAME